MVNNLTSLVGVPAVASALSAAALAGAASANADAVAYLVAVTVRPGYNFANGNDALAYGRGNCDKVEQGRTYPQLMGDVKADFNTDDEYQASYLITQALNDHVSR